MWGVLAGSSVGLVASTLGRPLLLDLLCAARYAHAVALRVDPRHTHDRLRIPLCDSAAPLARHRPEVGGGRIDCLGRPGGMGGVRAAPDAAQSPYRLNRHSTAADPETVDLRRVSQPPRAGRRSSRSARCCRRSAGVESWDVYGVVYFAAAYLLGVEESTSALRPSLSSGDSHGRPVRNLPIAKCVCTDTWRLVWFESYGVLQLP